MNNDQVPTSPATECVPPTNAELDRRLRVVEAKVLGEAAVPHGSLTDPDYIPPTNAELDRRLCIVEAKLREAKPREAS